MRRETNIEATVEALARLVGGTAEGETGRAVRGVAILESAAADQVVFASSPRALEQALAGPAGCIVTGEKDDAKGRTVIRVGNPRLAFARLVAYFHPPAPPAPGVHPTAVVDPAARLASGISIGPCAVIGAGAEIGADCAIGAGCVVGQGARLGPGCLLHPRVTIYPGVTVGARAILHSGVVLGADGFGFVYDGRRYEKFPQVGTVEIGDDVEIGANTTVDRGALGVTRIGAGTKIDNLVQIAHNVQIGEHVVIAAQTGISGSCLIESHAVIGGQVGLGDHVTIKSGAVLASKCGVTSHKIVRGGQTYWGVPARPLKEYLAQLAVVSRLAKKKVMSDK